MKKRQLLFLTAFLFFNATVSLGKAIPYTGFIYNTYGIGFWGMWSPVNPSDPCGWSYRDYNVDETFGAIAIPSSVGATIGASNNISAYFNILVRNRHEVWEKSTKYTSGAGCNPATNVEMQNPTKTTYNNYPTSYYGFKVVVGGLTYYGWIMVSNGMSISYIEDIPGFSIKVGDNVGVLTYPSNFIKLSGTVYRDNNIDGLYNTGDAPVSYQKVVLENTVYTATTANDGTYTLLVPGTALSGSKNIKLQLFGRDVYNTPANGIRSITFPQYTDVTGLNFGINYDLTSTSEKLIGVGISIERHRRCFRSSVHVAVFNNSDQTLTDVPLSLEIPAYAEILNSAPAYQTLQSKVATYSIPSIAPHSTYKIDLIDSVTCGNESIRGQSQCYRASINIPFDGSDVFPYYECRDSMHLFKFVNKGNMEMSDSLSYKIFANNILQGIHQYKTSAQDTFYVGIPNDGRSIRVEVFQAPANTRTNMRYIIAEGCGNALVLPQNIGWADQLVSYDNTNYSDTRCYTIVDSYDPNELIASPTGWGSDHKILKEQTVVYRIGFQNTGSAEAVSIVLVDTLSSALDLSTFRIKYSTHTYKASEIVPLPDGRLRLAVTYAGINLPPSSTNEAASHGYIEFTILPKTTVAVGTKIMNQAFIYFDFNSYIATNTVLQTIALPETVSDPLSVRTSGGQFEVDNQMLTYGDAPADPALTTNAGSAGLVASSLNTDIVTFESGKLVIHKSGTATLNYKHNGNARYLPIVGEKQRTVTVEKAPLTIEAVSKVRFVGEQNPVWEWNATGFVYNEDQSVLQGNPEISCTADETSAMADYAIIISAGTLSADNYNITYVPGTLKVVQTDGIQDWSASGIRVYPIPSKGGNFTVDVPYEKLNQVTLTDMKGRTEVYDQSRISSQLQGIVLIKIYTDKNVYSGKIELTQ